MVSSRLFENPDYGFGRKSFNSRGTPSLLLLSIIMLRQKCLKSKALKGNAEADNEAQRFDYSKSAADADFEKGKSANMCQLVLEKKMISKIWILPVSALIQRGKFHSQKRLRMPSIMVQQRLWSTIMWKDRTLEWQLKRRCEKITSVFISKFMGKLLRQVPTKLSLTILCQPSEADQLSDFSKLGVNNRWSVETRCHSTWWKYLSSLNDNTYGDMVGTEALLM